jgi:flagellar hook protein FlgE
LGTEISSIQSLRAVDAWIDVINANISGGLRTAYKASRLKFSGSNVEIARNGGAISMPLQFPEASLTTSNSLIDWTQGGIVASNESTHLAINGEGFFLLNSLTYNVTDSFTRDGEFRTDANGFLQNSNGLYVFDPFVGTNPPFFVGLIWNDIDLKGTTPPVGPPVGAPGPVYTMLSALVAAGGAGLVIVRDKSQLLYSKYGSTVFELPPGSVVEVGTTADATVLSKSLEASNSSMTQSVPELSLAQKLFSALTKVLQTKQTNVDGVLNVVR